MTVEITPALPMLRVVAAVRAPPVRSAERPQPLKGEGCATNTGRSKQRPEFSLSLPQVILWLCELRADVSSWRGSRSAAWASTELAEEIQAGRGGSAPLHGPPCCRQGTRGGDERESGRTPRPATPRVNIARMNFLKAGSPCSHYSLHPLSSERERRANLIADLPQRLSTVRGDFFFSLPAKYYQFEQLPLSVG